MKLGRIDDETTANIGKIKGEKLQILYVKRLKYVLRQEAGIMKN